MRFKNSFNIFLLLILMTFFMTNAVFANIQSNAKLSIQEIRKLAKNDPNIFSQADLMMIVPTNSGTSFFQQMILPENINLLVDQGGVQTSVSTDNNIADNNALIWTNKKDLNLYNIKSGLYHYIGKLGFVFTTAPFGNVDISADDIQAWYKNLGQVQTFNNTITLQQLQQHADVIFVIPHTLVASSGVTLPTNASGNIGVIITWEKTDPNIYLGIANFNQSNALTMQNIHAGHGAITGVKNLPSNLQGYWYLIEKGVNMNAKTIFADKKGNMVFTCMFGNTQERFSDTQIKQIDAGSLIQGRLNLNAIASGSTTTSILDKARLEAETGNAAAIKKAFLKAVAGNLAIFEQSNMVMILPMSYTGKPIGVGNNPTLVLPQSMDLGIAASYVTQNYQIEEDGVYQNIKNNTAKNNPPVMKFPNNLTYVYKITPPASPSTNYTINISPGIPGVVSAYFQVAPWAGAYLTQNEVGSFVKNIGNKNTNQINWVAPSNYNANGFQNAEQALLNATLALVLPYNKYYSGAATLTNWNANQPVYLIIPYEKDPLLGAGMVGSGSDSLQITSVNTTLNQVPGVPNGMKAYVFEIAQAVNNSKAGKIVIVDPKGDVVFNFMYNQPIGTGQQQQNNLNFLQKGRLNINNLYNNQRGSGLLAQTIVADEMEGSGLTSFLSGIAQVGQASMGMFIPQPMNFTGTYYLPNNAIDTFIYPRQVPGYWDVYLGIVPAGQNQILVPLKKNNAQKKYAMEAYVLKDSAAEMIFYGDLQNQSASYTMRSSLQTLPFGGTFVNQADLANIASGQKTAYTNAVVDFNSTTFSQTAAFFTIPYNRFASSGITMPGNSGTYCLVVPYEGEDPGLMIQRVSGNAQILLTSNASIKNLPGMINGVKAYVYQIALSGQNNDKIIVYDKNYELVFNLMGMNPGNQVQIGEMIPYFQNHRLNLNNYLTGNATNTKLGNITPWYVKIIPITGDNNATINEVQLPAGAVVSVATVNNAMPPNKRGQALFDSQNYQSLYPKLEYFGYGSVNGGYSWLFASQPNNTVHLNLEIPFLANGGQLPPQQKYQLTLYWQNIKSSSAVSALITKKHQEHKLQKEEKKSDSQ